MRHTMRERTTFKGAVLALLALATPAFAQTEKTATRLMETELGNLVADAVRYSAGVEVAFVPAATFKGSKASSAEAALPQLDPVTDEIVILSVRGSQLKEALERSVSFAGTPFAGFLQVSGLSFKYDSRKEIGERVDSVLVGGKPLEPQRVYKLATIRPLADGQQGYFQIWKKDQIQAATKKSLAEALEAFGKTGATSKVEGRILAVAPR